MHEQNFAEMKNKDDILTLNSEITKENLFQHVFLLYETSDLIIKNVS